LTDKTATDQVISEIENQDCVLFRIIHDEPICEWDWSDVVFNDKLGVYNVHVFK